MKGVTTQPYAGAHGELTGILLMAAYHKSKGNDKKYVIVPDEAHGTNPASAAMGGYTVISIPVDRDGGMDVDLFREKMNDEVAGVMLTLPNTLGVFHRGICDIVEIARKHDAILYNDGANLNAILGKARPGDIGFDIVHMNLHKTFSTPHGGGGPGAGVVAVSDKEQLEKILRYSNEIAPLKGKLKILNFDDVLKIYDSMAYVNATINELGLVPEGF